MHQVFKRNDALIFCTDGAVLVNERDVHKDYAAYLKTLDDADLQKLEVLFTRLLEFLPFDVAVSVDEGALYLTRDDQPVLMVVPEVVRLGEPVSGAASARRQFDLILYYDDFDRDAGWQLCDKTLGTYAAPRLLARAVLEQLTEEALDTALGYAYPRP